MYDDLRERLAHVYWIGGGSGGGKSTVARRLADDHGLRRYATDDVMAEHSRRSTRADCPELHAFMAMDMDERWLRRSPQLMLETFHWYRGEAFGMIVDDLLRLPRDRGVVVEGFRLLPHLVRPMLHRPAQAVWLLPTPEFRRYAFADRGSLWKIAGQTSDPDRALANLLERDAMFTARVEREARELGLLTLTVDGAGTEGELADRVAAAFGLTGDGRIRP
ncbi:MAG: hypothetical protein HOV79_07455 [Hamadaea sp.]|nr:hypothetical protein [Hamadaea sp.]